MRERSATSYLPGDDKRTVKRDTHYTSLAASLAAGAELSRRGYDVAFTLGNTPRIDLICGVPDGKPFKVQVKGISTKNALWVQKKFFDATIQHDLFLIVVVVPHETSCPFEFFVLSHEEARQAFAKMPRVKRNGTPYRDNESGLTWGVIKPFKDGWGKLPACVASRAISGKLQ